MAFAAAYLNARARAQIGQILPHEAIVRLSALPSADEILRRLEADGYFRHGPADRELAPSERLREVLDADYRAALTVVPEPGRSLIRALYARFEAEFLKAALGCAWKGVPAEERGRYVGASRLLDRSLEPPILEAATLADVARRAPERFRANLERALPRVEQDESLFALGAALDIGVLHDVWLAVQLLDGLDRQSASTITGTWFDVHNIRAAWRLSQVFALPSDRILSQLIHHGEYLVLKHRRAIAGATTRDAVREALADTPYAAAVARAPDVSALETELDTCVRGMLSRQLAGFPFHFGVTIAYLFLKEIEMRDIARVVEVASHGVSVEAAPAKA